MAQVSCMSQVVHTVGPQDSLDPRSRYTAVAFQKQSKKQVFFFSGQIARWKLS